MALNKNVKYCTIILPLKYVFRQHYLCYTVYVFAGLVDTILENVNLRNTQN